MMSEGQERISLESLRQLARTPEKLNPYRLWNALTGADRTTAAKHLLSEDPGQRGLMATLVANHLHFREVTVQRWSDDKLAERLSDVREAGKSLGMDLLIALHIPGRSKLLAHFLDTLGIPNKDGVVEDGGGLDDLEVDGPQIDDALSKLAAIADERWILTYMLMLVLHEVGFASVLTDCLQRYAGAEDSVSADEPERVLEGDKGSLDTAPEDLQGLTTLDRQLILSIVNAAQEIEGVLGEDQIDDLVDEILHLNAHRHRSYFHAGFRDVLFDRELGIGGPEKNRSRMRWYWAGVVQGLARSDRWASVIDLFGRYPIIRGLGDGVDAASNAAAIHVATALFEENRPAEIPEFVQPPALTNWSPDLFMRLSRNATDLLRADRVSEAKGIFDCLAGVLSEMERGPLGYAESLQVKRRQAHCLQRAGEFEAARRVLEELLSQDPDPSIKAMILADLGLIDARLRSLADVKLPATEDKRGSFILALLKGRDCFQEASQLKVLYSAHADMCLGVLALVDRDFEKAVVRLDSARTTFIARRESYRRNGLIESTELYLGIALIQEEREARFEEASKMISDALQAELSFPRYLLAQTLDTMALLGFQEESGRIGEAVLAVDKYEVLDILISSEARSAVLSLADTFLRRASDVARSSTDQASDLRSALTLLLPHQRRHDEAASVLDRLEEMAVRGTGSEEFCALFDAPSNWAAVWSQEDVLLARARILESLGRTEEAGSLLIAACHRSLTAEAADKSEGILSRIKRLGLDETNIEPLERRLAALRVEETAPDDTETIQAAHVRILMVGGDERQEKRDAELRGDLRRRAPNIEVEFIRSGWSSNWKPFLDEFRGRLPGFDAVVIMRYTRTEFGRQVRKSCGQVPWRSCWGAGTGLAIRTIMTAAEAARVNRGPGDGEERG